MASMKDINTASATLGDLVYQVAVQNGRVISEDRDQILSVVFNTMVVGLSKSIVIACSAGKELDQAEFAKVFGEVHKEVLAAAQEIVTKRAGDGFQMLVMSK